MAKNDEMTAAQVQEYAYAFRNFAFSGPSDVAGDDDERVTLTEVYVIQVGDHNGRFLLTSAGDYLAVYALREDAEATAGLVGGKVVILSFAVQARLMVRATTGLPLDRLGQNFTDLIAGLSVDAGQGQRNTSGARLIDEEPELPF